MDVWDPAKDALIPHRFSPSALAGKGQNRAELLKAFSLPADGRGPRDRYGLAARRPEGIRYPRGGVRTRSWRSGALLVILGTGQEKYHELYWGFAKKYPKQFGVKLEFNDRLAHLIEAGSDFFLMPSRYEPCGLNQMYSLRYGTIPIVRATGGLLDTISDIDGEGEIGKRIHFQGVFPGRASRRRAAGGRILPRQERAPEGSQADHERGSFMAPLRGGILLALRARPEPRWNGVDKVESRFLYLLFDNR